MKHNISRLIAIAEMVQNALASGAQQVQVPAGLAVVPSAQGVSNGHWAPGRKFVGVTSDAIVKANVQRWQYNSQRRRREQGQRFNAVVPKSVVIRNGMVQVKDRQWSLDEHFAKRGVNGGAR